MLYLNLFQNYDSLPDSNNECLKVIIKNNNNNNNKSKHSNCFQLTTSKLKGKILYSTFYFE